jgi:hypothetical protein
VLVDGAAVALDDGIDGVEDAGPMRACRSSGSKAALRRV